MRFLGVDLAWGVGTEERPANRSGVVALESDGTISAAGWTIGLTETRAWLGAQADYGDVLAFVDAPLLVLNPVGARECEREVGRRYGRFQVYANSTNLASKHRAGMILREALEEDGWTYDDGTGGPRSLSRVLSECYPYTAIVGAEELGYDRERPRYKRFTKGLRSAEGWPIKTAACDELISRVARLSDAHPPLDLRSHAETLQLIETPSPPKASLYKQREDLLDAAICAWTAALWYRHGTQRCQVLGARSEADGLGRRATIIAPMRGGAIEGAALG
jgi:predicted RNase H-like nuclease